MRPTDYFYYKDYVQAELTQRELLEQLAEEAAELSQAALKLIRAMNSRNVTPVTKVGAESRLEDEMNDVMLVLDALDMRPMDSCENTKWERWVKRLQEEEEHDID